MLSTERIAELAARLGVTPEQVSEVIKFDLAQDRGNWATTTRRIVTDSHGTRHWHDCSLPVRDEWAALCEACA